MKNPETLSAYIAELGHSQSRWLFALLCIAGLAGPAIAQTGKDVGAIADRYLAEMQRKDYSFLSHNELVRRREQIAAFAARFLRQPLDQSTLAAVLVGIDRCIDCLYCEPAGKVNYGNGFGSGGEEWMYLNDRDYFRTFQYCLWFGLTRQPLTPAELKRRDTQRTWMRQYLTDLPYRGRNETPPREGMRNDEVRPWAVAELDKAFNDPLDLLFEPMPDEGFTKLQDRFKRFSNGIWSDLHDMEVAALTSRFVAKPNPEGRYGESYSGKLPFDDAVVTIWGNGPSLCFASNADFRGHYGGLSRLGVYDVVRCFEMHSDHGSPHLNMETWLAKENRGELTLDSSTLKTVRAAKIAKLSVKNWFESDKLSDDDLRAVIRNHGQESISVSRLPTANGPHRGDRSEGEFLIVVQNRENRLAVVNLYVFEFKQLEFWCRPRAMKSK
jgi:hypothetical protein